MTMIDGSGVPMPKVADAAFVHPSALLFGDITVSLGSSIWPYVVMRAEMNEIWIGRRSNIQDFVMIHVGTQTGTIIGDDCSITHRCTLHGCKIGDRVLVGIGSIITDGCEIGDNCVIASHTFLKEGTIIPPNSIVMGTPGAVTRQRNSAAANVFNAWLYHKNALAYAQGDHRCWSTTEFAEAAAAEREKLRVQYRD